MSSRQQPGRHRQTARNRLPHQNDEPFGIQPHERDGWGLRILLPAGGLTFVGLVAVGGLSMLKPRPAQDPFGGVPVLNGAEIVCEDIADVRYGTDDPKMQMIAGGGMATYSAAEEAEGGPGFVEAERVRPAAVAACNQYLKDFPDTPERSLFMVDSRTEPVAGQEGFFRVFVEVVPTGETAPAG